jgi:hypothetical protein
MGLTKSEGEPQGGDEVCPPTIVHRSTVLADPDSTGGQVADIRSRPALNARGHAVRDGVDLAASPGLPLCVE